MSLDIKIVVMKSCLLMARVWEHPIAQTVGVQCSVIELSVNNKLERIRKEEIMA